MTEIFSQSHALLLEKNGLNETLIRSALSSLSHQKIDIADVYFQHASYESWYLEEGIIKSGNFTVNHGMGVRAITGEKTAFAYADVIDKHNLDELIKTVHSINHFGQENRIAHSTQKKAKKAPFLYQPNNPIHSLSADKKVNLLKKIDQLAREKDTRVVNVIASLNASYEHIYIAKLNEQHHADIRPLIRLSINIIVEENKLREESSTGGGGRYNLEYFDDELIEQYIDLALSQALLKLKAQPAPAGEMPVVLGSGWSGVLLHEAVGHGLEGDFNRKGSSAFSGRIGEQVAAKGVTVVDQGNIKNRRGSLNIDDEGNLTQETILIEDGILKSYMQDEHNAALMNMPLTGNGRRESYAHSPLPRMTNTFMQSGTYDHEEIIASLDKGIYAENIGGGQVDITNGQFVFNVSQAWWVEKGKLCHPLKGVTLIGSGPEVLQHISMIGNNLNLDTGVGMCGKAGQSVPVGVGQPTLRIDAGLVVGGSQV